MELHGPARRAARDIFLNYSLHKHLKISQKSSAYASELSAATNGEAESAVASVKADKKASIG